MSKPRRLLLTVAAIGLGAAVLTGCYGAAVTSTTDVQVDCTAYSFFTSPPSQDLGVFTLHVSLDAPAWANPGETIPLTNVAITTTPVSDLLATGQATTYLTLTNDGLGPVAGSSVNGSGQWAGPLANNGTATFDPAAAQVTATSGVAHLRLTSLSVGSTAFPGGGVTCVPLSASSVDLAAVKVTGQPVTTTTAP